MCTICLSPFYSLRGVTRGQVQAMDELVCYGSIQRAFDAPVHTAFVTQDDACPEMVTVSADGVVKVCACVRACVNAMPCCQGA